MSGSAQRLKEDQVPSFGYLLKNRFFEVDEFRDAARRVAGGGSALDPKVVSALVAGQESGPLAVVRQGARRARLMAEGLTINGIATRLCLRARTVVAHVGHLMTKQDITDTDEGHRRVLAVLSYLRATR